MATSWSDRFLKKALMKIAETFPNWSASGAIVKEGSFLVDEFWAPQTMSGLLYGDVIVKDSIWNRYLGKIADKKEDFFFFGIDCLADDRLKLILGFRSYGDFIIDCEMVSLVHNLKESALVLRFIDHAHEKGNFKGKIISWVLKKFGIQFLYKWYQVDFGTAVRIVQEGNGELFRVDFRRSIWKSSFAKPLIDGKSILELIEVERALVEKGRARLQTKQKGTELLERLGIWIMNENDQPES